MNVKWSEKMSKHKKNNLETDDNQELNKAKASGSCSVFMLVAIIIVILILAFLGLLLANFINTPNLPNLS
jgi:flagellar biogenesis protein FliO